MEGPTEAPKDLLTVVPRARRACRTAVPTEVPTEVPTTGEPMVGPTTALTLEIPPT